MGIVKYKLRNWKKMNVMLDIMAQKSFSNFIVKSENTNVWGSFQFRTLAYFQDFVNLDSFIFANTCFLSFCIVALLHVSASWDCVEALFEIHLIA